MLYIIPVVQNQSQHYSFRAVVECNSVLYRTVLLALFLSIDSLFSCATNGTIFRESRACVFIIEGGMSVLNAIKIQERKT
jgi:hypothetical protein